MKGALGDVVAGKPPYMTWEVEVRNLEELRIAQEFSPDIIMLDNFSDDLIRQAVEIVKARTPRPLLEVSGGVTKERLATLATLGIDAVSIGALTTRAPNVDISMRIS
jgi:nicotinate-nucleotide pyrophosphorylase (carboxylating)